ncbi:hypothetical protein ABIB73_004961 [Bradyrhizobium sp. F1.4.3]|uniref:hypothetical protein n=1 Tax=Bradyrhizobium sp. F1.4.3 TaxID=3156356 RepID=UPI00339243DA
MMIDCAALVTRLTVAATPGGRIRIEPLPKGRLRRLSATTLVIKIVNQDRNTRQDVLQSNEIIRHGSRGPKLKCRIPPASNVKKKQEFA